MIKNSPDLQSVTSVGNVTTNPTFFQDTASFSKASATDAPIVADQLSGLGPSMSLRVQGNEYLNARAQFLGPFLFAGLIASFPPTALYNGMINSAGTSGLLIDNAGGFTLIGIGGVQIRGFSQINGFSFDTSLQGFLVQGAKIQTLFTNNAGIIIIPDPGAGTKTLATTDHENSVARHSWPLPGAWNARNIATTLTDQVTTFGGLTPGAYTYEIAGQALGMTAELDQVVTAGTLTLTLFKNGATTGNVITFTSADPVRKSVTFGTPVAFAVGDRAEIRWTTSVGFTPNTTIDFNAFVRGAFNQ